jgi:hypothetical protein
VAVGGQDVPVQSLLGRDEELLEADAGVLTAMSISA